MAALTFQAVANANGTHTVTRSTDDAIGAAVAALVIDNTKTKLQADLAIRALVRHWKRQGVRHVKPSTIATSGSNLE